MAAVCSSSCQNFAANRKEIMTKKQYLQRLQQYLGALSPAEVEDIVAEIEERFTLAASRGETVAQVIEKLGTPEFLAQSYLKTQDQDLPVTPKQFWTSDRIIRLVIVLVINWLVVLWWWVAAFSLLAAGLIATAAMMGASIMVIFAPLLQWLFPPYANLGSLPHPIFWSGGATLFFASLLGFLLLLVAGQWAVRWLWRYGKFCINWIKKA